ncbi:MAG: PA domain-containing protein, partial [Telluria sp.]
MKANKHIVPRGALAALLLAATCAAQAQASIAIVNLNAPGEGFNDPTPVQPVGGNNGTTLGRQRLIAFQHAAGIWGANLSSSVAVRVGAAFVPLACTADSAVLGSAGANDIFSDFPNAPRQDTWYPSALASKLARSDQAPGGEPHIRARFNSRLGLFPDCMPGAGFYLGLDNNHGTSINLVTVLLHEMAHGLGFQSFTNEETGEPYENRASVWDHFLVDNRSNKLWSDMSNEERRASAISGSGLSWNGGHVTGGLPAVLSPRSNLAISGAAAGEAAGMHDVGDASFGPPLGEPGVSGELMAVADQDDGAGMACTPLSIANAAAVKGNIALVDRGMCEFVLKAKHVQEAGARAMVVADNAPGPVTSLGGMDPTITIPAVRVSQAAGAMLKAALQRRGPGAAGVTATLGIDAGRLAGTDGAQRIRMFSPGEFDPGSSVSHYTTDARTNQLMEPSISPDLTHAVRPPQDLTFPLLQDIG